MSLPEVNADVGAGHLKVGGVSILPGRFAAPFFIALLCLLLYLPALGWGLPATVSWSQDTIAGVRTLGAVEGWPGVWKGRYPPLQYLILAAAYKPVMLRWKHTGEHFIDSETGATGFQDPHAPKVGLLIAIARLVTVVMAVGGCLGLWAAAGILTGDNLAAFLAGIAMATGAAYTYFAHLGNVDVPSFCWFAWSLYFFARLLGSRRWSDALLLGLFSSFAISTKDATAGMYPGMALVLLGSETRIRMGDARFVPALLRALLQPRWVVGVLAFVLPYLMVYGAFQDPDAYVARMKYWLAPGAETLHAGQHRYADQVRLLFATTSYAAGAVGWPMLPAIAASVLYTLRRHGRTALAMLIPAVGYYLIVIVQIGFVYSRFLFAPISVVYVLVGLAGASLWRRQSWPVYVRMGVPSIVLLLSLGYAAAINAEMLADSRYRAEQWFVENVERPSSIGAFSSPQYLPRVHELGYATHPVVMARESFDRPQPEYLILSSYNYDDFDETQTACMRELLSGRLGYTLVAAFGGRYLGSGSSWLSIAGWGAPTPGKISPAITILRRNP